MITVFEPGHTYRHTTGKTLRIVALADDTTYSGSCFIAENQRTGELVPVGSSADNAVNWTDITPDPSTSVRRWRKKPVVIEAIRWNGANWGAVCAFLGVPENGHGDMETLEHTDEVQRMDVIIHTLKDDMRAGLSDYIIKGIKGEFYPCREDIFVATYELVEEE